MTDEDPDAPVEERLARFGQEDHVRYYGDDFETRLMDAGLSLRRVTPGGLLGEPVSTWMKLRADEAVWIARPAAAEATHDVGLDIARLPAVWEGMLDELLRRRAKENVLRGRVKKLRAEKKRRRRAALPNPSPPAGSVGCDVCCEGVDRAGVRVSPYCSIAVYPIGRRAK